MKKSFIDMLGDAQKAEEKKGTKYTSHLVIGTDIDEDGSPQGAFLVARATPFETLGMIELLMRNLEDTKKEILLKLSTKEQQRPIPDVSKLIDSLPEDVREKVLDLKRRMDDAMERKDADALRELRKEIFDLKNPFSSNNDNDDDDNFNINDFKGGMA